MQPIDAIAELPGIRLGYWDTGGDGPVVVLLHAASGSKAVMTAAWLAVTWRSAQPSSSG